MSSGRIERTDGRLEHFAEHSYLNVRPQMIRCYRKELIRLVFYRIWRTVVPHTRREWYEFAGINAFMWAVIWILGRKL